MQLSPQFFRHFRLCDKKIFRTKINQFLVGYKVEYKKFQKLFFSIKNQGYFNFFKWYHIFVSTIGLFLMKKRIKQKEF